MFAVRNCLGGSMRLAGSAMRTWTDQAEEPQTRSMPHAQFWKRLLLRLAAIVLLIADAALAQDTARPEITPPIPHSGIIHAISFSPDGAFVATSSSDRTIKLWDARTRQLLRTFQGHTRDVRSVAFSPNGTTLVSGGEDGTVRLWDPKTGQVLRTFSGHASPVYAVAFSPDGTQVVSTA